MTEVGDALRRTPWQGFVVYNSIVEYVPFEEVKIGSDGIVLDSRAERSRGHHSHGSSAQAVVVAQDTASCPAGG
jgi:hypothetical protein